MGLYARSACLEKLIYGFLFLIVGFCRHSFLVAFLVLTALQKVIVTSLSSTKIAVILLFSSKRTHVQPIYVTCACYLLEIMNSDSSIEMLGY